MFYGYNVPCNQLHTSSSSYWSAFIERFSPRLYYIIHKRKGERAFLSHLLPLVVEVGVSSPKTMKIWTSKGFALPTRKSVAAELGYDKDELRVALVAGAPYATVWKNSTNFPIITNNFNNQFVSAFLGEQPLDGALK